MKRLRQKIIDYYKQITAKKIFLADQVGELVPNQAEIGGRFYTIQIASSRQTGILVDLQKRVYTQEEIWPRDLIFNELAYNPNCIYMIVYDQNQPVAFVGAWIKNGECHISNIVTTPPYQSQQIGSYLLNLVEDIANYLDCQVYSLEVRVSNKAAQALYTRLGFEPTRIKYKYYSNNLEDAVEMKKTLAGGQPWLFES